MIIEHEDNLRKEISNNFFLQALKVNDINYFVNDNQKNYIDNKIDKNNCAEDAIQNIFPSISDEDFKTEYLNEQRIYEILTNNTEINIKNININKNISKDKKHKKEKIFRIKK